MEAIGIAWKFDRRKGINFMDPQQQAQYEYPGEYEALRGQKINSIKEAIYKFFYNIWPSVQRVLSFTIYHTIRIIRGSVKIAMEQFKQ